MEIKNLQKPANLFEEIKGLDGEIIYLEKLGAICIGQAKCHIKLSILDQSPVDQKKPDIMDEHGFIKKEYLFVNETDQAKDITEALRKAHENLTSMFLAFPFAKTEKIHDSDRTTAMTLEREITEVLMLQILGKLLTERKLTRRRKIEELKNFGIII